MNVQILFALYRVVCSTWLTVVLALGRYIAVCRPLQARWFINIRGTRTAMATVCLGSFLFNLPRFWHYYPSSNHCSELHMEIFVADNPASINLTENFTGSQSSCPCTYNIKLVGELFANHAFTSFYRLLSAVFALFIPLTVMIVCNACLMRALRRSSAMQQRCCVKTASVNSGSCSTNVTSSPGHRFTPTLIALIVLFVVLVAPSEILIFLRDFKDEFAVSGDWYSHES